MMIMHREKGLAVASMVFALFVTNTASAQQSYSHRSGLRSVSRLRSLERTSGTSKIIQRMESCFRY
jgi:hypothetical protein